MKGSGQTKNSTSSYCYYQCKHQPVEINQNNSRAPSQSILLRSNIIEKCDGKLKVSIIGNKAFIKRTSSCNHKFSLKIPQITDKIKSDAIEFLNQNRSIIEISRKIFETYHQKIPRSTIHNLKIKNRIGFEWKLHTDEIKSIKLHLEKQCDYLIASNLEKEKDKDKLFMIFSPSIIF